MRNRLLTNGRKRIPGPGPVTLQTLTLSGMSFIEDSVEDTLIGTIIGTSSGSTLTLASADSHLKIVGASLKVGSIAASAGASLTPSIVETLSGATGSPKTSGPFTLTVTTSTDTGIPDDATILNNATDFGNALYGGADGTNYYFNPAVDWEAEATSIGGFSFFHPRNAKTAGTQPIVFWGQSGVIFPYIFLDGGKYVTFKYCTQSGSGNPSQGHTGFGASDGVGIIFDHCKAGAKPAGDKPTGFSFGSCSDCVITWCRGDQVGVGVACVLNLGPITIDNTWISHFSADAFDVFGNDDHVLLEYNLASDPLPDDGHPDSFQFASQFNATEGVSHDNASVTSRYNNLDRGIGGTSSNGPFFAESTHNFDIHDLASWGSQANGMSMSLCTHGTIDNVWLNSWDFGPQVTMRNACDDITIGNIYCPGGVHDAPGHGDLGPDQPPEGDNTNIHIGTVTIITQGTDENDRSAYLAFLAANPLIVTQSHWDGVAYS